MSSLFYAECKKSKGGGALPSRSFRNLPLIAWSICMAAILDFPAKQDIALRIKEIFQLVYKIPEQMQFKILRYLI